MGNWAGAAITAASMVGVALVLGILLSFLSMIESQSVWQVFVAGVCLAAGAFGADTSMSGGGASVGLGIFPLTITIAALAVAIWRFRVMTRAYTQSLDGVLDAVRVALIAAALMLVLSLVFRTEVDDEAVLKPDSAGAFFLTLLVTAGVLSLAVLVRRDWLRSRIAQVAHDWVKAPLLGFVALAVCLPVAGLIAAISALVFGDGLGAIDGSLGADIPGGIGFRHEAAVAVGFAGNFGLWALTLGSLGKLGAFGFDELGQMVGSIAGGASNEMPSGRLLFVTGDLDLPGLWVCVVLAPLLLAAAILVVIRTAGDQGGQPINPVPLRSVGIWVASLLVVFPFLVRLANAHVSIDAGFVSSGGGLGIFGADATFLVLLYAIIIAAVLTLATGVVDRHTVRQLLGSLNRQPVAQGYPQQQAPQGYPQQGAPTQQPGPAAPQPGQPGQPGQPWSAQPGPGQPPQQPPAGPPPGQ